MTATVICSDKTGTLTQNQMRVERADFPSLDASLSPLHHDAQKLIAEAIAVNDCSADSKQNLMGRLRPIGNATEGALLLRSRAKSLTTFPTVVTLKSRHKCLF